jgi:hypothetical protein
MANEIFTRLQLKHDTYANWMAVQDTFKPFAGEICVVEIPSANSATTTTPPTVLFKVGMYKKDAQGNDTTELYTFKELNWGSALAADVYAWAKEQSMFSSIVATTTTTGEGDKQKTYVGNAVTNVEWDSTLNEGKGGIKFTKGTQFATKAELDAALEAFGGDLDAITDTDTRYTFEIPTTGDHKGKLAVTEKKYVNGNAEGNGTTTYYDFITPDELETILKDYVKSVSGEKAIEIDNQDTQNPVVKLKIADIESPDPYKDVILTQDSNGLKAEFDLSKIGLSGDEEVLIVGTPTLGVSHDLAVTEDATIGGDLEVTGNITTGGKEVATKEDIAAAVAGAVDYLGTVDSEAALTAKKAQATHGDFVRVSTSFGNYHAGDLLVWHKEEGADGYWAQIHGEEGDITKITAGEGLELSADSGDGSVGDITINVKDSGITTDKIAEKNVTEAKLAQNVQDALALARTALQEHQNISGKADKVTGATAGNFAGLDANGNLTDSGKKAADFKTVQEVKDSYTGSTVKTVTSVKQNENGEITEVKFEDIDFSEVGHATSADVAYKLDTTKGDEFSMIPGTIIDGASIRFTGVAGGVNYTWTNDTVAIGVGSSGGKGKLVVDEFVGGRSAYTTIEGATVTTENVVTDKATIGGVEIKSNETATGAVKYLVFNCGSATVLVD